MAINRVFHKIVENSCVIDYYQMGNVGKGFFIIFVETIIYGNNK